MYRILLIEDEEVIRRALSKLLRRHDFEVDEAGSLEEIVEVEPYDLIVSDLRLPGKPGTEVIARVVDQPVIIMTSYASVASAVDAMKLGAVDYIAKPFDHDEFLFTVRKALNKKNSKKTRPFSAPVVSTLEHPLDKLIGRSNAMRQLYQRIQELAPTDTRLLIKGEAGSGCELVARTLHYHSGRAAEAFCAINCAAESEQTIQQELFGNHGGVGLFHNAQAGSLFLHEVGELPASTQSRLAQVLQTQQTASTPRILAATQHDLREMMQQGTFNPTLYAQLSSAIIEVPPLRERGEDVIEQAMYLLQHYSDNLARPQLQLGRAAQDAIRAYHWPGNVRELANAIERAAIVCTGNTITPEMLAINQQTAASGGPSGGAGKLSLEEYFREFVLENQRQMTETELAASLGISRKTLWERRQRFGIPKPGK